MQIIAARIQTVSAMTDARLTIGFTSALSCAHKIAYVPHPITKTLNMIGAKNLWFLVGEWLVLINWSRYSLFAASALSPRCMP